MSAMDDWGEVIENDGERPVLIIIEGLTMYLSEADVKRIFEVISKRFAHAEVLVETMSPFVVKNIKEKSIEGSKAKFSWGVKNGKELEALLPEFKFAEEHSLVEGMKLLMPIYNFLGIFPFVRNISNKICVMKK